MTDTTLQDFRNRLAAIKAQQRLRKKEYDLVMAVCDKAETLAAELDAAKAENERLRKALSLCATQMYPNADESEEIRLNLYGKLTPERADT